ncbi:bifunctional (p)ppGpp synthetase/guanosine-3',5'-bis(diphosphate) 3'-pyrophosphohydrolase [Pseudoprevotella muciniphila]|uniref:Bifunctional (P)ppGpp synthetase/guanosine-3',5'-bis(Diphosphate) 3'-pyrophosphohydrolase n=1 Tax=Pseudoprevotella muciniphila TaxID=2133944 RepID=A0A5P8E638_9BACT|nr:RelA/SpoT family protein [Pseudoprevotella muciniphila]QFQ12473.1 bifunctional (p)ppGpp synthetase/guanosine-3',5'-bis(diphosphate) 3'-pyrophosphohydrolase [Pseudoprevotella muciniphila]
MADTTKDHLSAEDKERREEEMIQAAFQKLLDTYLASSHRRKVNIITRAFNFAKNAHKGVARLSGEPYILHPIAVAQIVCEEIGLGSTSICAALLHDVVEDTEYSKEDIATLFGPKVANIVEGVTKISGGIFGEKASSQAETFKKLLLTMSNDVRVILVKIADRVHNMRTLDSMRPSKQYKIAGETLFIYAPIADRLGLNKIKTELENLSFKYEHPDEYNSICEKLALTQPLRDKVFEDFTPPIRKALDEMKFTYEIKGRVKTPYSIWRKMQEKGVPFEEIYDILAIRIIYRPKDREKENQEALEIYGALKKEYRLHPSRTRDWLENPKANGYRALHSTFMSKQGQWIEVQIRSDRMDEMAEQGLAAHWKYKNEYSSGGDEFERWLNSIKEILDDPQPDSLDFLDNIKLNLFAREIMVFTPKGELKSMPLNSTALDFAFAIHSMLGTHCIGAKVNHVLVPLSYKLRSGDQIEVMTSSTQHVQPEWLNYVTTAKARGKIQGILRRENREKERKGEEILDAFLEEKGLQKVQKVIDRMRAYYCCNTNELFLQQIGDGKIKLNDEAVSYVRGKKRYKGWRRFVPFLRNTVDDNDTYQRQKEEDFVKGIDRKKILTINSEIIDRCHIATCCSPIPGDDALGYITPENTLEIHQRSCDIATRYKARYGNNIIAIKWEQIPNRLFRTSIYIAGADREGILFAIAKLLHDMPGYTIHRITLDANAGFFQGEIDISVHDTRDVQNICKQLRKIEFVKDARRIQEQSKNKEKNHEEGK